MSETRDPNELMVAAQDVAPLAWVIDEIRGSLNGCVDRLKTVLGNREDVESLKQARNLVHQANGALQLLDLRGVAHVTEGVEQLLRHWEAEPKECQPGAVRTVESAIAAVIAYLEGVLSGRPNQPIRLYPYYRDVLTLNRAARIHPADLIFPDLTRRPAFHQIEVKALSVDDLRKRRARFEQGLLGFLRDPADTKARAGMREALAELEHLPQRGLARSFWWVVRGLLEALDRQALPVDTDLKRLLARLNLQLRRLIDGGSQVAERLMTDALYYVGRAEDKVQRVSEIKRLFGLEALIPPDFERPTLTAMDTEAVRSAKEALTQAKNLWGQVVTGAAQDLSRFEKEVQQARDAAAKLQAHAPVQALQAVLTATQGFGSLAAERRETLGLEAASALLFVEQGIDDLPQVDPEYATRTRAVMQRLDAAAAGQPLPDSAPWMSELARKAQDRLTMGTVVAETQATLREIEQRLDRFFRTPSDRADLAATQGMFEQVCGVLSVLGFEDPVAALRSVQQAVGRFTDPAVEPQTAECERIAENLGAIGFFVESLAQDSERARTMFRYDPATGMFSANLGQGRAAESALIEEEELPPVATPAAAAATAPAAATAKKASPDNVEASARQHQQEIVTVAQRLATVPGDTQALKALGHVLGQLVSEADLLDDPALRQRVAQAQPLFSKLSASGGADVARALSEVFAPKPAAPMPAPTAPMPATEAAADQELLSIFIEEANEVLDGIGEQLKALRKSPSDQAVMTTVRRGFHTLKGSSRMVGLKPFGEGAWGIEQCFNLWLAQERAASDDLLQLADTAAHLMRDWIGRIAQNARAPLDVAPLVRAAQRVREGGPFEFEGAPASRPAAPASAAAASKSSGSAAPEAPPALPGVDGGAQHGGTEERISATVPADWNDGSLEVVEVAAPMADPVGSAEPDGGVDDVRHIGPLEISHGLYSVFLNEADECTRVLATDIAEWRFEPTRSASPSALRGAHSLAGIANTVGLRPMAEIADALDRLMHALVREPSARSLAPLLTEAQFDVVEQAVARMRQMVQTFAAGVHPESAPVQAEALRGLLHDLSHHAPKGPQTLPFGLPAESITAHAPVIVRAAAPAPAPAAAPVAAAEPARTRPKAPRPARSTVRDEIDRDLLGVFVTEATDLLPAIGGNLRALAANPNDREVSRELMRQLHTVKGSARMAGAMRLGELVHEMETRIEAALQLATVPSVIVEDLQGQYDRAQNLFDRLQHPDAAAAEDEEEEATAEDAEALMADPEPMADEIAVEDEAPLAPVIDLASVREFVAPAPVPAAAPELPAAAQTISATPMRAAPITTPARPAAAQSATFIRVRSDVLDKLVDHAGEVSIARSKLENEVGTLKTALTDLTENISRLRNQLRELDIQADAQISARTDQLAKDSAAFDPLEFDRYTRLQELTRLLAESVEDVQMVQSNMLKGLSSADNDLSAQSRLTRDLQQQLMRVRLVPFGNIAERMYRVARQAAKELDKRVNLEIVGGTVEIDRGVLERMTGPFEHLIRNSIVHGIEMPAQRSAAGKRDTGEIRIEIRQEGNEIIVVVSDDGAGLNLPRIRSRAAERGLIGAQQRVSDRDLVELIFAPGFSTATEVTELAGRGVGMDVVRAELASFGGRIAVATNPGQGTRFTLYLPLTLAVTQVVLASAGGRRYALPAGMVEQVRRFKPAQLAPAQQSGQIDVAPIGRLPFRMLTQLLGEEQTVHHHHGKYAPVVLVRAGDDRIALGVDDVSSNQEVVVKNVGPQVSRLAGVLGATILGSGEIVLIINPVQLLARVPETAAGVAEPAARIAVPAAPARAEPVAPESEEAPLIMVVDDSLTVRRVTQRFLERNGFDVMLAKDGVDALRQLQDQRPDIMLVDIEMPRMDGYDLTRNVRGSGNTRDIPIIMITSRTAEKHRNMALEIGVNEYLGKPYQEEELLGLIKKYLAQRERVAG